MTEVSKALPAAGVVTSTVTKEHLPEFESYRAIRELLLQAHPDNTENILVGNVDVQSIVLIPGDSFVIPIENPAQVYHKSSSGSQTLGFLGRD